MISKEFFKNKKVFVTGHTGFKGSWLCFWLNMMGANVTGYSLAPDTDHSIFDKLDLQHRTTSHIGNINDLENLKEKIINSRPEIIFHLAAQPIVRVSYVDPVQTYITNVIGTANVLQCVRECKTVRAVVNVTTDKVYENSECNRGYSENDVLGGYDPYSNSKACSELVTKSFRDSFFNIKDYEKHRVTIATARAGNVIGGGDWAVDRLIPDCIKALQNNEEISIRNPNAIRPWQHVLEPLSGYLTLGEMLYTSGCKYSGSYNFGPDDKDCINVLSVVKHMCEEWGSSAVYKMYENDGPHEASFLKLDCSKSKNMLNWYPVWDIQTAIKKTVEWYKAYYNNENIEDIMKDQIVEFMEGSYDRK